MDPVEIKPGIFCIGVNDRRTDLFEGLWPIHNEGISYNSYLINDEKRALIDLSKEIFSKEYLEMVKQIIPLESLDYIIVNHMEPDHSGALQALRREAPHAEIVGTKNVQKLLNAYYGIQDEVKVVNEKDCLQLGKYSLKFIPIPFVHWPESMMSYEPKEGILFSNDAFGSYGTVNNSVFEDEGNTEEIEQEALRYYSNIVSHYYKSVGKALTKLDHLPINLIAPSHGPIWRQNLQRIIDNYRKWVSCAQGDADTGVTILYASMYQNTERMMQAIARGVSGEGVPMKVLDIGRTHTSYVLPQLLQWKGVIVGGPTYEGELFPAIDVMMRMAIKKKISKRKAVYFGSFGWGGCAKEDFLSLAEQLEWKIEGILEFNGAPMKEDLKQGEKLGAEFAREIKNS